MEVQDRNADSSMGNKRVINDNKECGLDIGGTPLPGDDSWYDPARWDDSLHAMQGLADLIVASYANGVRLQLQPMPTVAALKRAFKETGHPWRGLYVGWLREFSI